MPDANAAYRACANCGQPLELVDLPNGTGLRYPAWFHVASSSTACTMPPQTYAEPRSDKASSASRQHYIDTGRYLDATD